MGEGFSFLRRIFARGERVRTLAIDSAKPVGEVNRRIALVVGIDRSGSAPLLANPKKDARLIADALTDIGFEVQTSYDSTRDTLLKLLADFGARAAELEADDVALFYFAGNGFEIGRVGFLGTTDTELPGAKPDLVLPDCVKTTDVLDSLKNCAAPRLLFLDTCRLDPFAATAATGVQHAPITIGEPFTLPANTLIAYSTAPGSVAQDGSGSNSPYATAFAKAIRESDRAIIDTCIGIRQAVFALTNGQQLPWEESRLTNAVHLKQQPRAARAAVQSGTRRQKSRAARGAPERIALLIGNGNYSAVRPLRNPGNDAHALSKSLKRLGFSQVIVKENLDRRAMSDAVEEFGKLAQNADWALVYFAGHGLEYDQRAYVVPVDATLKRDTDIDAEAYPVLRIQNCVTGSRRLGVSIIDACRDNPFVERMERVQRKTRSIDIASRLPAPDLDENEFVAYAAKHGHTACDGTGSNSPYMQALIGELEKPGVEIDLLFRRVRDAVRRQTEDCKKSGKCSCAAPYSYSSLPAEPLYFNQP